MKRAVLIFMVLWLLPAFARAAVPIAEDPALEKRVMALAEELRCLVCQNESLAGSPSDLAKDLRREIREQMKNGKSDQEILDFMVQRYGEFILYRPPVKSTTLALWFGPFVLLGGGAAALIFYLKRRRTRVAESSLSEDEQKRADALLNANTGNDWT